MKRTRFTEEQIIAVLKEAEARSTADTSAPQAAVFAIDVSKYYPPKPTRSRQKPRRLGQTQLIDQH